MYFHYSSFCNYKVLVNILIIFDDSNEMNYPSDKQHKYTDSTCNNWFKFFSPQEMKKQAC